MNIKKKIKELSAGFFGIFETLNNHLKHIHVLQDSVRDLKRAVSSQGERINKHLAEHAEKEIVSTPGYNEPDPLTRKYNIEFNPFTENQVDKKTNSGFCIKSGTVGNIGIDAAAPNGDYGWYGVITKEGIRKITKAEYESMVKDNGLKMENIINMKTGVGFIVPAGSVAKINDGFASSCGPMDKEFLENAMKARTQPYGILDHRPSNLNLRDHSFDAKIKQGFDGEKKIAMDFSKTRAMPIAYQLFINGVISFNDYLNAIIVSGKDFTSETPEIKSSYTKEDISNPFDKVLADMKHLRENIDSQQKEIREVLESVGKPSDQHEIKKQQDAHWLAMYKKLPRKYRTAYSLIAGIAQRGNVYEITEETLRRLFEIISIDKFYMDTDKA